VNTLEQQLSALCATHGLKSIEICYSAGERTRVDVYVRRGAKTHSDHLYGDNIDAAFKDALAYLNEDERVDLPAFGTAA